MRPRTRAYDPSRYADHGTGLFFVGLEANGTVYAYALNQVTGGYTRVATISSGFTGVMDLQFEAETGSLWAVCDDTCNGRTATLEVAQDGATDGRFVVSHVYERPASMPNLNNEGFAIAPQSQCVSGSKAVFWSDDSNTDGYAIRTGSINCTAVTAPTNPTPNPTPTQNPTPGTPANPGATTPVAGESLTETVRGTVTVPSQARPGQRVTVTVGASHSGETVNVWMYSTPVLLGTFTVSAAGTVSVVIPADAPAGAHRIAVLASDGTVIGWDNITVAAASSSQLPYTGADVTRPLQVALGLLIAGAGLLMLRRRQRGISA